MAVTSLGRRGEGEQCDVVGLARVVVDRFGEGSVVIFDSVEGGRIMIWGSVGKGKCERRLWARKRTFSVE